MTRSWLPLHARVWRRRGDISQALACIAFAAFAGLLVAAIVAAAVEP